jgi:hypothetical protein
MMAHDGVRIILKIQLDPNGPKLDNNVEWKHTKVEYFLTYVEYPY